LPDTFTIQKAKAEEVLEITHLVAELLMEIMQVSGIAAFTFDPQKMTTQLGAFMEAEKYHVFLARSTQHQCIGVITLYEGFALYAEGAFGTIAELYVQPGYRSQAVGQRLIEQAEAFGRTRGWRRLEVTTPPLPEFQKTLAFYEQAGFAVTGGRKLKILL